MAVEARDDIPHRLMTKKKKKCNKRLENPSEMHLVPPIVRENEEIRKKPAPAEEWGEGSGKRGGWFG